MKIAVSIAALAAALLTTQAMAAPAKSKPTAAEAKAFVDDAEKQLFTQSVQQSRADWINATYLTDDTDQFAADIGAERTSLSVKLALEAAKYKDVAGLDPEVARKLDMLRGDLTLAAPTRDGAAQELARLSTGLQSRYGKGQGTLDGKPINGSDIEEAMGTNRNPVQLKEMWTSWHDNVGGPMREDYSKLVSLANQGAKELGYKDTGDMWRSGYDMPPQEFAAMVDRLWQQVKPLYEDLHCYTRTRLNERYGDKVQGKQGAIRADLLGNMWAQQWSNIFDIAAPKDAAPVGFELGELLTAKQYDPLKMVKAGEGFYTSLGLAPLPESFWQRSMFVKPRDREVVCHASAWDIDNKDDLRIKMCIKVNGDDFVTIHHELGHNYYQRAYSQLPYLYLDGANDGFHEAIGDFIALSVTPEYLVQIGLLDADKVPSADKDIGLLLRMAMDKVAFLPFGLLVDKWRWAVFSGQIKPGNYNGAWNALRLQYQGIEPPVERGEEGFDPGAKYHIPGNTPYMRYFLAHILQFQFYKAACEQSGWTGPLHRCSFYGNKAVGEKLNAMLAMGASKPWPEALAAFTGSKEMSAQPLLDYFAPLQAWLKEQNKGKTCGW